MDDSVFYRSMRFPSASFFLGVARSRLHALFCREFLSEPGTSILDIGCSTVDNENTNFLEKLYPYPDKITCAALGDGAEIRAAYPNVGYVRIVPGHPLPFADGAFDIAYSNAVLEHVGNAGARHRFLSDAMRVARNVFIAVPNRWFPVEHHTGILLLHFSPALLRHALKSTRFDYWAAPDNLEFLSSRVLERECAAWPGVKIVHSGLPLGRLSSNVAVVWNRTIQ
ncbi:MAG TPA: methyltransferase domain-containing protein [Methyloceanibacter sp.]|nr:methyltransferase domain-containing protein [Methyloceanibacter sp.]